jgi:4-amino-4-deoxychorismate lyase
MNKLLETIKIVNGTAPFLAFHNERLNHSRQILFNAQDQIDLKNVITAPSQSGTYKCRVIYSKTIETVEYSRYQQQRKFKTFKVIEDDNIAYDFKYLNRENLNRLVRGQADEILIIKRGLVTDTTIANVAFWHQDKWLTPSTPLLKGTTRERLLREKKIVEIPITLEDLNHFSKMAMMNALLGFIVIENFKLIF